MFVNVSNVGAFQGVSSFFNQAATPVFDARLTGDAWYMTANPTMHDVIEVGYLDGNPTPFLEEQQGWTVDGVEMKVRIDACATPLARQTMYRNPGA